MFQDILTDVICSDAEIGQLCDVYGGYTIDPWTTEVFLVNI